jgi:voltage-gated potassium channel
MLTMALISDRQLERINRAVVSGRIIPYLAFFTLAITLVAALAVRAFDHRDFETFGEAVWWSAQTVTTVGYGDVIPESTFGKAVAVLVMAFGVAAVSFTTAVVTSAFMAWHQARLARERGTLDHLTPHEERTHESLARIEQRLEAMERRLS